MGINEDYGINAVLHEPVKGHTGRVAPEDDMETPEPPCVTCPR